MPSFFDSDDEDVPVPTRPTARRDRDRDSLPNHASSSRASSPPSGSSFVDRLRSTMTPSRANRSSSTALTTLDGSSTGIKRYDLGDLDEDGDDVDINGLGLSGPDGGLGKGLEDFEAYQFEDDNDVKQLIRAWMRERGTRDIMLWEGELLETILHKVEQQGSMLELLRSDPKTSEEEHFKLQLVSTEVERVKYLIRSYLRCRLDKVERYSHHITLDPEVQSRLSELELNHARQYTNLLHQHFSSSVLNSLPEWLRRMDDVGNDGTSMVRQPNKEIPVLIHVLKDCGEVVLSDGERASLEPESMHLIKYELVERFVRLGWVEVL